MFNVQHWFTGEPIASCSIADAQRIREAVAVLSHRKPRQEDVRPLQSKWQVAQRKDNKPRPLGEVLQECRDKVVDAAKKLQRQISDSAERPSLLPDSAERPALAASSTDRADVQNDPAADQANFR